MWPFNRKNKKKETSRPKKKREPRVFIPTRRGFEGIDQGPLFASWQTGETNFNETIGSSLGKLRDRARDLEINNPYVKRWLDLQRTFVLGELGIRLVSTVTEHQCVGAKEKNESLENAFNRTWSKRGVCEVTGRYSFVDLQKQVLTSVKRDGEAFIRILRGKQFNSFGFTLQLLRSDQCDESLNKNLKNGKKICLGVELDAFGKPVAYYFKKDENKTVEQANIDRYNRLPAEEVIHVFAPKRPEQVRGVPDLHAVMGTVKMLAGYFESEHVGARVGAAHSGFFKKTMPDSEDFMGDSRTEDGDEDEAGEFDDVSLDMSPGTYQKLPLGWDFVPHDPKHPTDAFAPFVTSVLQQTASGLGTGYSALTNDYSSVNYSSLRAAMGIEHDLHKEVQGFLVSQLVRPVFDAWIWSAALTQKLNIPAEELHLFMEPTFQGRRWQSVDPVKEVNANKVALETGQKSLTEICAERGRRIEDVLAERAKEAELLKTYGLSTAEVVEELGGEALNGEDELEGDDQANE